MNISDAEQELNLKDYINVLYNRRNIVILFFSTVVFLAIVGSLIVKPIYRATTTLLIDMESPNVLTTSGVVALESQHYYSYKEYYQSQKEIITAYSVIRKVFDEFNLADSKDFGKAKEPIKEFLKTITVESVRDTRLLKIHVDNKDPVLAAKIANRIAEIYVKRNLFYISRDELMNLMKNEYLKLEAKLSEYRNIYKDKHPQMIRLKKEMAELIGRIEEVSKSDFDYDAITSSKDSLDGYRYALEGLKANNVSIQDPAEVPVIPIKPKKRLNVLFAAIVGLFGGVGLAFFFEYLDDTIKRVEDVERLVRWPFLGNIPTISNGTITEVDRDFLVHKNPTDPIAEAYRSIRTSILFSSTEEHPLKSLVITSPGPQEGKTTTLCNLAATLTQSRKKVLLIDADMRRPRLHDIFKKSNKIGLSNFLSNQSEFKDVIQKTEIDNLFLISGGPHSPNPSELLSSYKMEELLKTAKEKFDFVLFDSPPIAVVTDAAIISRTADGIVVVVESGKTSKRILSRISQVLENIKARVVGMVLNRIVIDSTNHYYYAHYYGKSDK